MDKTIVKRWKGPQILEIVVGTAAAAALLLIGIAAVGGKVTADLILWGSGAIVMASVGGLVVYIAAAIAGTTPRY
jgi:hypothetical protein